MSDSINEQRCEVMHWQGEDAQYAAERIVAWVNDNGGEARYLPTGPYNDGPRIALRTADGWAFTPPGWYVVMTNEFFVRNEPSMPIAPELRFRLFQCRRTGPPAVTPPVQDEQRWNYCGDESTHAPHLNCCGYQVEFPFPAVPSVSTDHTNEPREQTRDAEPSTGPWTPFAYEDGPAPRTFVTDGQGRRHHVFSENAAQHLNQRDAAVAELVGLRTGVDQLRTENERALDERRERWKAVAIRRTAERDALQAALAKAEARMGAAQAEHDKHTESGRRTGLSVDCVCVGCRMAAALGVDPQKEDGDA